MLPELSVTGSSEAILQGQKPPFRLLARAIVAADGIRATHIRPAVSEPFVVSNFTGHSREHVEMSVRGLPHHDYAAHLALRMWPPGGDNS